MPTLGEQARCAACDAPIVYKDPYWDHLGENKPRHIARPAEHPNTPIYHAIERERLYQDQKWGTLAEHPHEVGAWITLMRRELAEAEEAWCTQRGDAAALREILQVIAVGVACLEQHGIVER